MKKILIHIGTPKTGTTSIQHCLAHAEMSGHLGSLSYPLWRSEKNQQRLAMLYPPDEILSGPPFPESKNALWGDMSGRYRQFIFRKLRAASCSVLSAEMLSCLSPNLIKCFRDDLLDLGYREFYILMYVRDPADFFLSQVQQIIKGYTSPPFIRDPFYFKYDFIRIADNWEEVFPGSLTIRHYRSDPNYDAIQDFSEVLLQRMGVVLPHVKMRKNASLSAEGMHILQEYRQRYLPNGDELLTSDAARLADFLINSSKALPQTKPVLKQEVAAWIKATHKEDAAKLLDRFGVDLGLNSDVAPATFTQRDYYHVDDIVETVDRDTISSLLFTVLRAELGKFHTERSWLRQLAAEIYWRIPVVFRPVRFGAWLKKRLN